MLVGAAMVSTRAVANDVPLTTLAFLRYLVGFAILAVPVAVAGRVRFALKDLTAIAALGILQFAVLILLLNYALSTLSASTCALVFATMPLFTMCFAVTRGSEAYSTRKLAGVALAVAGVVCLLSAGPNRAAMHTEAVRGFAALVGATLVGAITSLLYRPYLRRYLALPTCGVAMGAAVLFLGIACLAINQPLLPHLPWPAWSNVLFLGLSSGVGYFCWLWALANMDASRVVAFQALGPVTAAIIESIILRRAPTAPLLLSLTMITLGLTVAMRNAVTDKQPSP
ncbi:MAG: DMT family transporter [Paraburkholderia sp.]|nr:MAG: DMT family transporter [Paraburkholderia sp.]